MNLSPIAIERALPRASILKGREYWQEGRVRQVRPDAATGIVHGVVEGGETYEQRIAVKADRFRTLVEGVCTCPVGYNCKHVAAVLLALVGARTANAVPQRAPGTPAMLERWLARLERVERKDEYTPGTLQRLLYVFGPSDTGGIELRLVTARALKSGGYSGAQSYRAAAHALLAPPSFVLPSDVRILRALLIESDHLGDGTLVFAGQQLAGTLERIAATGRAHWETVQSRVLALGETRKGTPRWTFHDDGTQRVAFDCARPITTAIGIEPPWYIDAAAGEIGPLETPLAPRVAALFANAPDVPAAHATLVVDALAASAPDLPRPRVVAELAAERIAPVPVLRLSSRDMGERWLSRGRVAWTIDFAEIGFEYAGATAGADGVTSVYRDGVLKRYKRDLAAERAAQEALKHAGFVRVAEVEVATCPPDLRNALTLPSEGHWLAFMGAGVAGLRNAGWKIVVDRSFRFDVIEPESWFADVTEDSGRNWFKVELGIEVAGERMSLARLLPQLVQQHPRLRDAEWIARAGADAAIHVRMPDGRVIRLALERLRPILTVFHEIADGEGMQLSRLDAPRLTAIAAAMPIDLRGAQALAAFGERLASFGGIEQVAPPAGLAIALRPYQARGLAWLQFLRDYGLAGILADDMGLGKTVQTLAHILVEKAAGRLDRPALVVAPTSLVHNWRSEAERFAPGLSVLALRGPDRARHFDAIPRHDLVVTTYPLLARDHEALGAHAYHLAILDEAQNIKNASTRAAGIVRGIEARHRLCLTGTPLENHLGELWSLFHFLLPGFLGDERSFRRHYRTPIEKEGDAARREQLARRVRPFVLRRTKPEVAAELPPKTEIVRTVELAGGQRDLYESVRVMVDRAVRAEIERVGLAKSQIAILDALLKLRQVCCDPRLVKMSAARHVTESAKLVLLADMLTGLVEEGRRVLVFSQFTSMLALIEQKLGDLGIDYVLLTGDTRDRERPVKRFQAGEVPVFLISLKAGGTGLNLTAADTVIHYDPWWNPAVETQATDRAHRIGQEQPVFVYKLVVAGSVEERIVELQQRKAEIANAILAGTTGAATQLTPHDLQALFEPIESNQN